MQLPALQLGDEADVEATGRLLARVLEAFGGIVGGTEASS